MSRLQRPKLKDYMSASNELGNGAILWKSWGTDACERAVGAQLRWAH